MAGGKVWVAPLISMVAERRGRSWRTTLRIARPVRFWVSRATARAVNTMVRCASIASRVRWNMGRAARSVLDIRKDCSTCHRSWWQLITSAGGMRVAGMLVTYPFRPARRRARARADSSRARAPVAVVTNLGARAAFAPATTSRARFPWAVSVVLSRTKRLRENAHTARHEGRTSGRATTSGRRPRPGSTAHPVADADRRGAEYRDFETSTRGPGERKRKPTMGLDDKIKNTAEETKGKAKEAVGDATDNERLQAEGRAEKAGAHIKQAGENVKDAFK